MEEDGSKATAMPIDKLTIYAAVKACCDEIGSSNSLFGAFSVDEEAMLLISELVYRKLEEGASDLESFANHAKRNNVNVEDVKLAFRKNLRILELLKSLEDSEEKDKPAPKRKRADVDSET